MIQINNLNKDINEIFFYLFYESSNYSLKIINLISFYFKFI
jgi:hypothetical protein